MLGLPQMSVCACGAKQISMAELLMTREVDRA